MNSNNPEKFLYLCEVRGLITARAVGDVSYSGNYCSVYFDTFKMLAHKRANGWTLVNKIFPLNYRGGCYGMANSLGI